MQLRVAVMGGGSWGTTIASMVSRNTPTVLWARDAATVGEINEQHTNQRYLPRCATVGTADRHRRSRRGGSRRRRHRDGRAVADVPRDATDVARYIRPWVPVISLAKGLEAGTQARMTADHRGSIAGTSARRADRAESRARDHGRRRGGQRARDGRRHDRATPEGAVPLRIVPRVYEYRRHRLRTRRRAEERRRDRGGHG